MSPYLKPLLFLFVVRKHAKKAGTPVSTYVGTDAFRADLKHHISAIEIRSKRGT